MRYAGFQAPVGRAVAEKNVEFIRGWLLGRFGVEVKPARIAEWLRIEVMPYALHGWLDHSWRCYFKRRLEDAHMLPCGSTDPEIVRFECDLHVAFVGIPESEEELAILRREDRTPVREGPDTPGISRTIHRPEPIDRVAARVVS